MTTDNHTHVINSAHGEVLAEYTCKKTPPALKWWLGEYEAEQKNATKQSAKVLAKVPAKAPKVQYTFINNLCYDYISKKVISEG